MTVYFLYYILLGISAVFLPRLGLKKVKWIQFILVCTGLFLILALRSQSMGVDLGHGSTAGYLDAYRAIARAPWGKVLKGTWLNYEKGYVIFNKLISYLCKGRQCLLICSAAVSIIPIVLVYRWYSEQFEFSVVIYMALTCFLVTFSGLRQACAIGICFSAVPFIRKRKFIPFLLIVLLATTFHKSAILFLPGYLAYAINIKKKIRWITLLIIVLVFVFRVSLFEVLSPILKDNAVMDNNGALTLFLVFVVIYIFCDLLGPDEKEHSGLMNLFLIAISAQAFGSVYNTAGRVGYYYMPFLGLLLPKTLKNLARGNTKYFITWFLVAVFVAYGLYALYSSGDSFAEAYPYLFFWQ